MRGLWIFRLVATALVAVPLCCSCVNAEPPCPTLHIAKGLRGNPNGCTACIRSFEESFPRGARIYSYDQYVLIDGHRDEHFSNHAKMFCDAKGLHIVDPALHSTALFSFRAKVISWHNAKIVGVRPGEPIPPQLARDLRNGIAHFKETIR
jgi:hypothetical protein